MPAAFESQTFLILATVLVAWWLPNEARMRQLTRPPLSAEKEPPGADATTSEPASIRR